MDFKSLLKNPYIISLPTLIVPGLSHFLLGKKVRAVIFFVVVLTTFLLGIFLNGGIFFLKESNWLYSMMGYPMMPRRLLEHGNINHANSHISTFRD